MSTSLTPVALTAMHHLHVELGATMVEKDGWRRPAHYGSADEETERLRNSVGLLDISPDGKINLSGMGLDGLLSRAFGQKTPLGMGDSLVLPLPESPDGPSVTLARLAADEMMAITEPAERQGVLTKLADHADASTQAVDVTSALAGVAITGPSAYLLLSAVSELNTSPGAFPNLSCAQSAVAEVHGTFVRADIGEVLSYRLYFGREFGQYMWEALLDAGLDYDAAPVGLEALAMLER